MNDKLKAIEEQEKFCLNNNKPRFAPGDGICWACSCQIYDDSKRGSRRSAGISIEKAKNEHITGCPHCGRTFLDW